MEENQSKVKKPIYKKWWFWVIAVLAFFWLIGIASETGDNSTNQTSNGNIVKSQSTQNNSNQEGEGTIGDYYVKIEDCEITKDYSGDPILLVKVAFTNNSDEAKAFSYTITDTAFQNDVEIKSPISTYGINNYDWKDSTKEIKPGVTYEFNLAYELSDTQSDVTIEMTPFISTKYSSKITKTFKLSK